MSVEVEVAGETHQVPSPRESGWGQRLTDLLVSIADNMLTTATALTAEFDLGATYGIRAKWFRSQHASPAVQGVLRLGRTNAINWRNEADDGDISLAVDSGNNLTWATSVVATALTTQTLLNKTIRNVKDDTRAYARYTRGTTQSIAHNTATIIDFATSGLDSRAAVTTGASWKFTAPAGMGGIYLVSANVLLESSGTAGTVQLAVHKGGSIAAVLGFSEQAGSGDFQAVGGSTLVSMLAGDYIDLRVTQIQNSGSAARLVTAADAHNHVSIVRMVTDL